MKGLELSKEFFEKVGKPMLEEKFGDKLDRMAIGLVGHGSECFGFDDETSIDHDFEPGFYIWLTEEDERAFGFKLFRAYNDLPKEYNGVKMIQKSLLGDDGKGVRIIKDFYSFYLPNGEVPQTNEEWLSIPDSYLREATNGIIFMDQLGEFTKIRNALLYNRPEDVRLKKLASNVFYMAQYGQYNYQRCLKHHEYAAAGLALAEFAKATAETVYLLNRVYAPYYKWIFKGMEELTILSSLKEKLEELLKSPYDQENNLTLIEQIAVEVANEIRNQGLSDRTESYLEGYAYCINNKIKDGNLRNMPVML